MSCSIFSLDSNKCTLCYSCVRNCPVKAINVKTGDTIPEINPARCIGCGNCIKSCAFNAISIFDSREIVKELINSEAKIAAICDPSIAGEFEDITDYRKFVQMIRQLGFDYVTEVAFGVDLIANKQAKLIGEKTGKYYLTSHCPVINLYVEKYHPELLNNLTKTVTPASATAVALREIYGQDLKIVNISPCYGAKKDLYRHENSAKIDAVLSFRELRKLFKEFHIKEENVEYSDFDPPFGNKGSLYPIPEGYVEACGLSTSLIDSDFITAQGKTDATDAIKQFEEHGNRFNKHFNLYFCKGCIVGPGSSINGQKFIRHNLVTNYSVKRTSILNRANWENNIEKYKNNINLQTSFKTNYQVLDHPSEEKIESAFAELGKEKSGRHIDCRSCGYESCYELAEAIAQGIASPDMCFTHTQSGNRTFISKLNETNKKLERTYNENQELKENINTQITNNYELSRALSIFVQNLNIGVAIVDSNLKISESNHHFIDILGEEAKEINEIIPGLVGASIVSLVPKNISSQINFILKGSENIINKDCGFEDRLLNTTIFSLIPRKSICVLFRNLYDKEAKPEEIINRVTEIIDDNLRQVQQIGFILGEGAAKTEKMLNTIIKLTKNTQSDDGEKAGEKTNS